MHRALCTTSGELLAHDERLNIDSEMRGEPGTLNYEDREKRKTDIETINQWVITAYLVGNIWDSWG